MAKVYKVATEAPCEIVIIYNAEGEPFMGEHPCGWPTLWRTDEIRDGFAICSKCIAVEGRI